MTLEELVFAAIAGLGLLGGVGYGLKAFLERKNLTEQAKAHKAKAGADEATAASIVAAAARELIDPLRAELAAERVEHAEEIAVLREKQEEERRILEEKQQELVQQLDEALLDVVRLREELTRALEEVAIARALAQSLEEENRHLRSSSST